MFQPTFKNFSINFGVLNERTTFSSGDVITGHLSFDLTKKTKITSMEMALSGRVHVHWSTGGGGGGGRRRRRRQRRNYSAKVDFFNCKTVLAQENRATGEIEKLQPGTHVDFPSSFRGVHGEIEYKLTVTIHRPWHMPKDFVTELNFVSHINTSQPELRAPLSGSNQMRPCFLWCAAALVTMTASAEKKAFTPGETVRIICDISNPTSWTTTPKVRLQQKQDYFTHNRAHKRSVSKNLASVTGEPVGAETSDVHTEIMLTIPPSASPTISNCSILAVHYVIEVNLCGSCVPELTVLIPIVLCDTPVHTHAPSE